MINPHLEQIVADFETLLKAYAKAGMFDAGKPGSLVGKLLGGGEDIHRFRRDVLLLDAIVRHRVARLLLDSGDFRHVAVFGGNNVGKSTVINILVKERIARDSPVGGETQLSQVITSTREKLFGENAYAFRGFLEIDTGGRRKGRYCYVSSRTNSGAIPSDVALWDAPDVNAIGAVDYMHSVVETVAAADILIYVTTMELYAVDQVVEWVFQLSDAGIPIVECLNRIPKRDQYSIIERQAELFQTMSERLGLSPPAPQIVVLRNMGEGEYHDLWGPEHLEADELRAKVLQTVYKTDRAAAGRRALDFVSRHAGRALEPVRMEIEARQHWSDAVEAAVSGFVASYERSYLTSKTAIEPISRLNVEILELLDPKIFGLREAVVAIRWVTRWPSKLILAVGKKVFSLIFTSKDSNSDEKIAPELKVYSDAHTVLLNTLGRRIEVEQAAERHHPFWDTLGKQWQEQLKHLTENFGTEVQAHMKRTDLEIKSAARDILEKLEQSPSMLNFLRGVRVTADVGGALVGIILPADAILPGSANYVYDLLEEVVLAPSMVIVVETATNFVAQRFVAARRDEVIEKLKQDARRIAETLYHKPLLAIAETAMAQAGALGVDKDILERLPAQLAQLQTACGES